MAVLIFRFRSDIRNQIQVPFFDSLYSEITNGKKKSSQKDKNSVASIIFGPEWFAIIRPKANTPSDLHAWCWKVLRDGLKEKKTSPKKNP